MIFQNNISILFFLFITIVESVSFTQIYSEDCLDKLKEVYHKENLKKRDTTVVKQYLIETYTDSICVSRNKYIILYSDKFNYMEDKLSDVFQNDSISITVYHPLKSIYISRERLPLYNFNYESDFINMFDSIYTVGECFEKKTDVATYHYVNFTIKDSISLFNKPNNIDFLIKDESKLIYTKYMYVKRDKELHTFSNIVYNIEENYIFRNKLTRTPEILYSEFLDNVKLTNNYQDYQIINLNK